MSRTFHHGERRIKARGIRRDPTDLRRLAKAFIALAEAQAEADAAALPKIAAKRAKATTKPVEAERDDRKGAA